MSENIRTSEEAVRILRELENNASSGDINYTQAMLGVADRYIELVRLGYNTVGIK